MNAARPAAGVGSLEVELVPGAAKRRRGAAGPARRSWAERVAFSYPLKLVVPAAGSAACGPAGAVVAYVLTYGGGLVAGDAVELCVRVGRGATAVLLTQASTKVFKPKAAPGGAAGAAQTLRARVAAGALLASLPHAVTCFAGAALRQEQRVELDAGGSCVVLDWLTEGRVEGRSESWAFAAYRTRTLVAVAGEPLLVDAMELVAPAAAGPTVADRMAGVAAFATCVLVGPRLALACATLKVRLSPLVAATFGRGADAPRGEQRLSVACSPLLRGQTASDDGEEVGLLVRVASASVELAQEFLRDQLAVLEPELGVAPAFT